MNSMITIAEAAAELGVVDSRVRQLIGAKTLSVRRVGQRVALLDRGEVTLYRDREAGLIGTHSALAAFAPSAGAPARPLVDEAVEIPGRDGLGWVHLRVWESSTRCIAVCGPVAESALAPTGWHFEDFIAPRLVNGMLSEFDLSSTVWIVQGYAFDGRPVLANPVLLDEKATRTRWLGRVALDRMDAMIGRPFAVFPIRELATRENIAAAAAAAPERLQIEIDPYNTGERVRAIADTLAARGFGDSERCASAVRTLRAVADHSGRDPLLGSLPSWMMANRRSPVETRLPSPSVPQATAVQIAEALEYLDTIDVGQESDSGLRAAVSAARLVLRSGDHAASTEFPA